MLRARCLAKMCPNFQGVAKELPVLCTGQFGALDGRSTNLKFIQSLEFCVGHDRIFNPINFTYYTRYIFFAEHGVKC